MSAALSSEGRRFFCSRLKPGPWETRLGLLVGVQIYLYLGTDPGLAEEASQSDRIFVETIEFVAL